MNKPRYPIDIHQENASVNMQEQFTSTSCDKIIPV